MWTRWPDDLGPGGAPVYTCNELAIDAPAEAVWAHLIAAEQWPAFYANARDVSVGGDAAPLLALGTVFRWKTFGLRVETRVEVFEPPFALAWRGDRRIGRGFHTWLLTPTATGCRVVTEEVQRGVVPSAARWYLRRGLRTWHQRWLEGLRDRACAARSAIAT
jgi:hypothetical protein